MFLQGTNRSLQPPPPPKKKTDVVLIKGAASSNARGSLQHSKGNMDITVAAR